MHTTGHYLVANSLALKMAEINDNTPEPAGGTIVRDPETGRPTGVLKEPPAMDMVRTLVPVWSTEQWRDGIQHAMRLLLEEGITAVKENHSRNDYERILPAYRQLKDTGDLKIRCYVLCRAETVEDVPHAASNPDDFLAHKNDDLLKLGGIKVFIDGSLVGRTAWVYEEYYDPIAGKVDAGNRGYPAIPEDLFKSIIEAAHANGFQIAVHAIGDRATDVAVELCMTKL